ncbi:MAG TPA: hypothetical protein VHO72_05400 [Bacteroidales bacterium]|nr:hypothetical protein [Bacteroidales bacterium]
MRKLLFITLISTLAFTSCVKDDDEQSYEAEVTIAGTKTTISDLMFYTFKNGESKYYNITSSNDYNENSSISIYLLNPAPGTMAFGEDNAINITIDSDSYYSTTGSFTITEVSESFVSGSFTGKFRNGNTEIQISGSFSAEYKSGLN